MTEPAQLGSLKTKYIKRESNRSSFAVILLCTRKLEITINGKSEGITVLKHSSRPFRTPSALCSGLASVTAANVHIAKAHRQYFKTILILETDLTARLLFIRSPLNEYERKDENISMK